MEEAKKLKEEEEQKKEKVHKSKVKKPVNIGKTGRRKSHSRKRDKHGSKSKEKVVGEKGKKEKE